MGSCLGSSWTPGILPSLTLQTSGPPVSSEEDEAGGPWSVDTGKYKLSTETPGSLLATQLLECGQLDLEPQVGS